MEEELLSAVPCSSLAVESVVRVATVVTYIHSNHVCVCVYISQIFRFFFVEAQAGGLYGFCAGPRDARKIGILKLARFGDLRFHFSIH